MHSIVSRKRSTDDAMSERNWRKKFDEINSLSEEGIESQDDGEKSVIFILDS